MHLIYYTFICVFIIYLFTYQFCAFIFSFLVCIFVLTHFILSVLFVYSLFLSNLFLNTFTVRFNFRVTIVFCRTVYQGEGGYNPLIFSQLNKIYHIKKNFRWQGYRVNEQLINTYTLNAKIGRVLCMLLIANLDPKMSTYEYTVYNELIKYWFT